MSVTERALREISDDPFLRAFPRAEPFRFVLTLGAQRVLVDVGRETEARSGIDINDSWDFEYVLPQQAWHNYRQAVPPPGFNTAQALLARLGSDIVTGDRARWAQYAPVVERVLQILAGKVETASAAGTTLPGKSDIVGRYLPLTIQDTTYRVYYESAGSGVPIVCLHTAGSDSRQYHHLMENPALTERFQFFAFDLPWHGRSNPPADWRSRTYSLEVDWYTDAVLAFQAALGLDRPALIGCSMGGVLALQLSSQHGEKFRSVISLEGGFGNPSRKVDWTRHAEVDHSLFLSTWVAGLMSPASPIDLREQVLWEYGQSGPGVYHGDTHFMARIPDIADSLGPAKCPLHVFCGEYDYSSTPEMSRAAAQQLGGRFTLLEGMGHFPMAEDPGRLLEYLNPVLDEIAAG
ncbi:MAG: alpha/beta fold hydrolase [Pseudonocardiaceae bacterium]|nr:alpha/beta fold hydrolase [Pseudonocardiaceae bacterium]